MSPHIILMILLNAYRFFSTVKLQDYWYAWKWWYSAYWLLARFLRQTLPTRTAFSASFSIRLRSICANEKAYIVKRCQADLFSYFIRGYFIQWRGWNVLFWDWNCLVVCFWKVPDKYSNANRSLCIYRIIFRIAGKKDEWCSMFQISDRKKSKWGLLWFLLEFSRWRVLFDIFLSPRRASITTRRKSNKMRYSRLKTAITKSS